MDVSVIIVNYNTKQVTLNCINSIFEQTKGVAFEVILVDNASEDGSVELFSNDPRIYFIESGSNIGFGRANNLGAKHAKGKYLFLLNSDTVFLNNAIKLFYDKMETLPLTVSCIGTILKDYELQDTHSYAEFPKIVNDIVAKTPLNKIAKLLHIEINRCDKPYRRKEVDFEVPYVTGADMFVRKEVFEQFKGFDPDFFMYCEEVELQYRFAQNGYSQLIVHGPSIIHLEGASSTEKKHSIKKTLITSKSDFLYFKKHYSLFKYYLYRTLLFILFTPKLIRPKYSWEEKRLYFKILLQS